MFNSFPIIANLDNHLPTTSMFGRVQGVNELVSDKLKFDIERFSRYFYVIIDGGLVNSVKNATIHSFECNLLVHYLLINQNTKSLKNLIIETVYIFIVTRFVTNCFFGGVANGSKLNGFGKSHICC